MAKETLKKTTAAIAIALFAVANMNITANAQELVAEKFNPESITAEGKAALDSLNENQRVFESRYRSWQEPNGHIEKVWIDGFKGTVGGGYSFGPDHGIPYGTVGVEFDGGYLWSWKGRPVRLFSGEVNGFFGQSRYAQTAYSAGQKYVAYGANGLLKVRLWEDDAKRTWRHRINAMAGIGYTYTRHDQFLFTGHYRRINDDGSFYVNEQGKYEDLTSPNEGTDALIVPHYASGWTWCVGLGYSVRPFDKLGSRIEIRALASRDPAPQWSETPREWRIKVELVLHLGGRHTATKKAK